MFEKKRFIKQARNEKFQKVLRQNLCCFLSCLRGFNIKSTEKTYVPLKIGSRDFQYSPPFERLAFFNVTITKFFEQFQYCKDIHREKSPSNNTPAITKSMNMDSQLVGTSNQLFVKDSLKFSEAEIVHLNFADAGIKGMIGKNRVFCFLWFFSNFPEVTLGKNHNLISLVGL